MDCLEIPQKSEVFGENLFEKQKQKIHTKTENPNKNIINK